MKATRISTADGFTSAYHDGFWIIGLGCMPTMGGGIFFSTVIDFSDTLPKEYVSNYWLGPTIRDFRLLSHSMIIASDDGGWLLQEMPMEK